MSLERYKKSREMLKVHLIPVRSACRNVGIHREIPIAKKVQLAAEYTLCLHKSLLWQLDNLQKKYEPASVDGLNQ